MSTPSRSASARASALGRTLNPTTRASEADARLTSFSVIPPTPVWMTLHAHLAVLDLLELAQQRLDRALTSPFRTMFRSWTSPASRSLVERLEGDAPSRALCELFAAEPLGAHVREMLRLPLVLDDADELARRRRVVEAEDLDRVAGLRLLTFSPR